MKTGTVKFFNTQKGFGFIQPEDGSPDMFVHITAIHQAGLSGLDEGQKVSFDIEDNRGKDTAANIKIIGLVNEFKLVNYYNESSVFCLPTLEDGGPMVIPQAMSCGIPVISSKYCIAPDLITSGQEGYIIDPRNTKEIAEKIKFLYDNPNERSLMGKMARKKIEEIGSWDNVSERLIDFFNKKLKLK